MLIHCRPDQWRIVAPTKIVLHLIRHSQGFHNLSVENHALHDPSLTDLGKQQCRDLQANFPYHAKITHLVASPLRRTIYTCLLTFADEVEQGLVVVALPEIQETSGLPCDTGSDASKLREEFGEAGKVDLSLVKDGWNNKKGRWAAEASAVEKRAKDARLWLRDMASKSDTEEVHIAVVTHGGFLHYLTEDWAGCEKFVGKFFRHSKPSHGPRVLGMRG